MILLQAELITELLEQSAAQSFGTFVLAVMIGLLCLALGFIWRQYTKAMDVIMNQQSKNDEMVQLLKTRNDEAIKELIIRLETERKLRP